MSSLACQTAVITSGAAMVAPDRRTRISALFAEVSELPADDCDSYLSRLRA